MLLVNASGGPHMLPAAGLFRQQFQRPAFRNRKDAHSRCTCSKGVSGKTPWKRQSVGVQAAACRCQGVAGGSFPCPGSGIGTEARGQSMFVVDQLRGNTAGCVCLPSGHQGSKVHGSPNSPQGGCRCLSTGERVGGGELFFWLWIWQQGWGVWMEG